MELILPNLGTIGSLHSTFEAASSSHGPPEVAHGPVADQHPPGEADSVAPSAEAEQDGPDGHAPPLQPSGVKRPKVYATPAEDLAGMMPPGAKIVLSHTEHRFLTTWVGPTKGIPSELIGKHFTRSFGPSRSWQDALSECHQRLWEKWGYISTSLPLPPGSQPQEPGVVPDAVLEAMAHHIGKMPVKKDYTTKR